jgi:S1-C subfamily serine protease
VAVAVVTPLQPETTIPSPLDKCFQNKPACVVGTGFFVNTNGDVVTASHVANGIQARASEPGTPGTQQIIEMLGANAIHASTIIAVSWPNVEARGLTLIGGRTTFPVTLVAADAEHDIAVFHATVNPFTNMPRLFSGPRYAGLPQTRVKFVSLAVGRPRDGEEIFACGFPFGEPGLVTTSGAIASAWKTKTLLTATAAGLLRDVEIYWADLRLNPGNSGGPVFRPRDQAMVGMVVEVKGSLGVLVPAKYVSEFLTAHGIQWRPATHTH